MTLVRAVLSTLFAVAILSGCGESKRWQDLEAENEALNHSWQEKWDDLNQRLIQAHHQQQATERENAKLRETLHAMLESIESLEATTATRLETEKAALEGMKKELLMVEEFFREEAAARKRDRELRKKGAHVPMRVLGPDNGSEMLKKKVQETEDRIPALTEIVLELSKFLKGKADDRGSLEE